VSNQYILCVIDLELRCDQVFGVKKGWRTQSSGIHKGWRI